MNRLALLLAALAPAVAAQTPALPGASLPLACLILPDRVADVGSPVLGVVEQVLVERGDNVAKGQVLARLRAEVERASVGVARTRVDAQGEIAAAKAAYDLAEQKAQRTDALGAQDYVSPLAVEQARAERDVARQKWQQAQEVQRVSGSELGVAAAQLRQREVRAPFDGVVVERYMNPGERVEDKPIVKLAALQPLRVEVVAPVALYGRLQLGQAVPVQPELPGAVAQEGRITQIDRLLDPASNTFRVRLALDNADAGLPGGLRCKLELAKPPAPAISPVVQHGSLAATIAPAVQRAPAPGGLPSVAPPAASTAGPR